MLRTITTRSLRVNRLLPIIISARPYSSEGSTGSGISRPAGEAAGDAFTKREKAAEDYYVRKQENQKLLQLREKLKQQRKHLDELDAHIEDITKEQGGEKN